MSLALRSCIVLMAAATAAMTADPDPEELFQKVRARVLDDVSHVPRYTCVQTVNRAQYRQMYTVKPASCRALIAARRQLTSPGYLIARDRLRLDVAVVDGAETFSWAGARRFETSHVDELVKSGATGSGEFVSYLISVFGRDTDSISYLGQSLFAFNVPPEKSHYSLIARSEALRRYFVEGCSWEAAAPPVKDPNRVADSSTLRRWFQVLDSSRPPFSFLRSTVRAFAQRIPGGQVLCPGGGQLSWPIVFPLLHHCWPLRI